VCTAAVILNAAAAFYVAGVVSSFDEGIDAARDAINAGTGLVALDRLRTAFDREPGISRAVSVDPAG
jgi:anthranilate phosphoribosyltransferase